MPASSITFHPTPAARVSTSLQLLHRRANLDLRDLINPLIIGHIKPVLRRNILAQEPTPDKMPLTLVKLDTRLRRCQTDQVFRHKIVANKLITRRPGLDVPRGGSVDRQYWDFRGDDARENFVEGFAYWGFETESEESIDNQVCGLQL